MSKRKQFSLRDKLGAIDRVKSRAKVRTDLGLTKLRTFLVDIDSDEGLSRKRRRLGQDIANRGYTEDQVYNVFQDALREVPQCEK